MIKFRWFYDSDENERFLNRMSKKGYAMTGFFLGFYKFEKCEPNEYTYKIDLINDKRGTELDEYIDLIEETGGEFIQRWGVWGFFRKKGKFELYTDVSSKIEYYTRIRRMFGLLAFAECCFLPNQIMCYNRTDNILFLVFIFLIVIIEIVFIVQVYKCSSKIRSLKDSK